MNLNSTWSSLDGSYERLGNYGYPAMDKTASELGLASGWFTWVAAISLFAFEPFTTAQFMRMFPYGLASLNEGRFKSAMRQGYLSSEGQGRFRATESGENVTDQIFKAADLSIAHFQPMPAQTLQRLVNYLRLISEASLLTPEPPAHFLFAPWACLSEVELEDLSNLAMQLHAGLITPSISPQAALWRWHHAWRKRSFLFSPPKTCPNIAATNGSCASPYKTCAK